MKRDRRGVALVLTLVVLAMLGAAVGAVFYPVTVAYRLNRNAIRIEQAQAAAESGLEAAMGTLRANGPPPAALTFRGDVATGWYRGTMRPVSSDLVVLTAEGFSADSMARSGVAMVVRVGSGGVRRVWWIQAD